MKTLKDLSLIYLIISASILIALSCSSDRKSHSEVYHSPESLENYLEEINQTYPTLTYLEPAGESIEGRTIWALVLSDNPTELETEPKVRLIGSIHGDENATTEVLMCLIDYLLSEYMRGNPDIIYLIHNRYIVFIPMMNPDGVVYQTRYNANNVDLNRNFSEQWTDELYHGDYAFSEPESQGIRDYSDYMVFHSSLTFHTGSVVVNMPFDYASANRVPPFVTPEESDLVQYLALQYAESGRFLETPGLMSNAYTNNGTINGGDWYIVNGSLQDWSYLQTGCIDFTVEISRSYPDTNSELDELFDLNRDSIIAFIEASGSGVYGRITDSGENPIEGASITIVGGDITTYSDSFGYYYRILLPDENPYNITFTASGYSDHPESVTIPESNPSFNLDVTMTPE